MKLLVINKYDQASLVNAQAIPHVGDRVDMFYEPKPRVTGVLMWPRRETLSAMSVTDDVEAIVTVD